MKENISQIAFNEIKTVDPLQFSPEALTANPKLIKDLNQSLTLTRSLWSVMPLCFALGFISLITQSPDCLLVLLCGLGMLGMLIFGDSDRGNLFDAPSGYFGHTIAPLYTELVDLRIINFEHKTGGIYQLVEYFDTSKLDADALESCLHVIQQSQNRIQITDQKHYALVISNIQKSLNTVSAETRRKEIIASLNKVEKV